MLEIQRVFEQKFLKLKQLPKDDDDFKKEYCELAAYLLITIKMAKEMVRRLQEFKNETT